MLYLAAAQKECMKMLYLSTDGLQLIRRRRKKKKKRKTGKFFFCSIVKRRCPPSIIALHIAGFSVSLSLSFCHSFLLYISFWFSIEIEVDAPARPKSICFVVLRLVRRTAHVCDLLSFIIKNTVSSIFFFFCSLLSGGIFLQTQNY